MEDPTAPHVAARAAPPVVLVPSERVRPGDAAAQLVLRRLPDGTVVMPGYSCLDELVRCCGVDQPWVALRADTVEELLGEVGAAGVALDVVFADDAGGAA